MIFLLISVQQRRHLTTLGYDIFAAMREKPFYLLMAYLYPDQREIQRNSKLRSAGYYQVYVTDQELLVL